MDRLLLYLLLLVIFGVVTFSAQFAVVNTRPLPSTIPQAAVIKKQYHHHHHATDRKNNNCSAALLAVPHHQAVFLHIGKAAGGTFMHRARHVWRLQVEECHPDPCHYYFHQNNDNNNDDNNTVMTAIVSIRDPVDRFVSAFYWKRKTICARHPNLCANNAKTWQQQQNLHRHRPPPSLSSSSLSLSDTNSSSLDIMQRYILFEKYQQNANMLAESLCRDNDNYTAFVEAQVDVGMIAHMKNSIHDWLAKDWDVMVENSNNTANSTSMSRRRRRSMHSIRPIVLEPNFDLEEQIDDALLAIATQQALLVEDSCPHRQRPKEGAADQEKLQQYKRASRNGGPRHVHSSLHDSNYSALHHVLSEKGTRCVAQFYRRDYEIIRQLSYSSTCPETCRLALESIWNRRSPLLLDDQTALHE